MTNDFENKIQKIVEEIDRNSSLNSTHKILEEINANASLFQVQKAIEAQNSIEELIGKNLSAQIQKRLDEMKSYNIFHQIQETIDKINRNNPWNQIQERLASSATQFELTNTKLSEVIQFNNELQTRFAKENIVLQKIFETIDSTAAINNWKNFIESDKYVEEQCESVVTDQKDLLLNDALSTLYYFLDICTNALGVENKRQAFWAFLAIIIQWYVYVYPLMPQTESLKQLTFQQDPPAVIFETTNQKSYEFPLNLTEDDSLPFPEEPISDSISGA
ncbi:MAG: hypothetical protein GXZ18_07870 [Synergistaceae bacterium]|nr:hypothetical protein [Synergistaceae bacterium]